MHEDELAGVEDLELRAHPELLHAPRHRPQHPRRVDHHVLAAGGEVHRAAVERADLGEELLDVGEALAGAGHVGGLRVQFQRRLGTPEHEVAAHARGQVEHDVDVGRADPLDGGAVERRVAGAAPARGVANVEVGDRGARPRGLDRGVRDLLGRHRDVRAARRRCRRRR